MHYEGYGKNLIKKFKASPDAWAQLVKQLAFYKMYNRPGVTYESAQTRKYQLGRTEVIRSSSSEAKAWVESMLDPNATVSCRAFGPCEVSTDDEMFCRINNAPPSSALQLLDIYNTRPGRLMGRVLTDTYLA